MYNLGKRQLQKLNSGYYVNAPAQWVKHHKLEKGAVVELIVDDTQRLIISPVEVKDENP